MIETAQSGLSYGVEVRASEDAPWVARCGWFPQVDEEDRYGYDRAMENYDHLTDVQHVDAKNVRVVKRETKVTVIFPRGLR